MVQPTINDRLQSLRKHLGLNQKEMSERLMVRQSFYSDLEKGRRNVSNKFIEKISETFSVDKNWLYTGIGDLITLKKEIDLYPKNVPPIVPFEKKGTTNDVVTSKLNEVLIERMIERTMHIIRFYCIDLMGRAVMRNELNKVYKKEEECLNNLRAYADNLKEELWDSDDLRENLATEGHVYTDYSIQEKLLLLNKLNEKVARTLDDIWLMR